jgi:excisionase family DNA binding protein
MPIDARAPLLEVAHVAHRLGFGQKYVRRLIRDKKLAAVCFGRRWRIDPADLQSFIDARRSRAGPSAAAARRA